MATSLGFCESIRKIEELKLEVSVKIHKEIGQLELEMFKKFQASQERMACLFASVMQNLEK